MSKLTFFSYEVEEAIRMYAKEKLGLDIPEDNISVHDYPSIEYRTPIYAYKKHKNGKEIKDKYGCRTVDWEKTKYKTQHIDFNDDAEITFYLGG